MKYIFALFVLAVASVSLASAATGSTSTGSTSSGSTSTGSSLSGSTSTGSTSTGVVAPAKTCSTGLACAGGPSRGFNLTTKQWDMIPQCFPYTWIVNFYKGNIFDMYRNQEACRVQRKIDFGM